MLRGILMRLSQAVPVLLIFSVMVFMLMHLLPGDPAVAVAAGTAMVERQLWGKARRPLEQAAESAGLVGSARRHAWRSLAQLAQREGDEQRAQRCTHAAAAID